MQQDCAKVSNNQESKLRCEFHPECKLKILHLGEKSSRKSRMLCVQCIIESNNNGENLNQFIYMHDVIRNIFKFLLDPKKSILQLLQINNQNQQNISQALDGIVNSLLQLEESIMNKFLKIKENIQQIRLQLGEMEQEVCNKLQLTDAAKQIQLLKQMDSYQGTNELRVLESQLNFISVNLSNTYANAYEKLYNNQLSNLDDNLHNLIKEIENLSKQLNDRLNKFQLINTEMLEDIKDFPEINQLISEGKKIEYTLLYQGTRDGLNSQAYWSKCNLQQNLLTIMASKNGNKFGGYSPCQINYELNTYVQDHTMKSFIFQYNKKEIYKLKRKDAALQCCYDYGPIFGGCDIEISSDFLNGGRSNLGHAYDISGYNILDKASHLFDQPTPQLQELKVYKVNFR